MTDFEHRIAGSLEPVLLGDEVVTAFPRGRHAERASRPARVTVCLPVLNAERNLGRCLDSILAQSFADFRLVVVDNASTDATFAIACGRAAEDPRVVVYRNARDIGRIGNWNRCLDLAEGGYVKLVMVNDLLLPDCLAESTAFMDANPSVALLRSTLSFLQADGRVDFLPRFDRDVVVPGTDALATGLTSESLAAGPTGQLLRRSVLEHARLRFDERFSWAADYEFSLRVFQAGDLGYLRRQLYHFDLGAGRFHNASAEVTRFADECRVITVGLTEYGLDVAEEVRFRALARLERLRDEYAGRNPDVRGDLNATLDEARTAIAPATTPPGSQHEPESSSAETQGERITVDGAHGFTFLSVFDWTLRKGWDVLVRAYAEEFAPGEDVTLVLKPFSSAGVTPEQMGAELEAYIRGLGRELDELPDIVVEFAWAPDELMPALYRGADCFVLPSRAEGKAGALRAASAAGCPTIATAWGAAAELVARGSGRAIDFNLVPAPGGAVWAEPDGEHLRALMRAAATGPQASSARRRPSAGARPEEVSFVVQGPVEPELTPRCCDSIRAWFPGAEIVVSTWRGADTSRLECDEVVVSEDPGTLEPFSYNTNRQLVSSLTGIRASSRPLVAKVRSDLVFHGDSLLRHWRRWDQYADGPRVFGDRVLVPNVFTRKPTYLYPLPHHPSDWAFFGARADVELLFDVPLLAAADAVIPTPTDPLVALFWGSARAPSFAPEQYIWVSAVRKRLGSLRLAHPWDFTPETLRESEALFANNLAVLDTYGQFGLSCPKYPDANRIFADRTLYQHEDWLELYETYCTEAPVAGDAAAVLARIDPVHPQARPEDLRTLRRAGCSWEAQLLESVAFGPGLQRDITTGGERATLDLMAVELARKELRALLPIAA